MKITKELIENMVREAINEAMETKPEAEADSKTAGASDNDDVSRILTKQDMERINTNPEFLIKM